MEPNRFSLGTLVNVRCSEMSGKSSTYTGKVKCKSRCLIKHKADNSHRMVNINRATVGNLENLDT